MTWVLLALNLVLSAQAQNFLPAQSASARFEPTARRIEVRHQVCVADDVSTEYSGCNAAKSAEECTRLNTEQGKRCEYAGGRCAPWTIGQCLRWVQGTPSYQIVLFSQYIEERSSKRLADLYSQRQQLSVRYFGHGPSPRDFGYLTLDVIGAANTARSIEIRSMGCQTFHGFYEAKARERFSTLLSEVHEGAKAFHSQSEILVTANQFVSAAGNGANEEDRLNEKTQTPLTLKVEYLNKGGPTVSVHGTYPCRSQNAGAVTRPDRWCHASERETKARSMCREGREWRYEVCKAVTFNRENGQQEVNAIVGSDDYEYLLPARTARGSRPDVNYEDARVYCERRDRRLPTYFEASQIIERQDLFREFGLPKAVTSGAVWTTDRASAQARTSPQNHTYLLGSVLPNRSNVSFGQSGLDRTHYFFCVPN